MATKAVTTSPLNGFPVLVFSPVILITRYLRYRLPAFGRTLNVTLLIDSIIDEIAADAAAAARCMFSFADLSVHILDKIRRLMSSDYHRTDTR